MPAAAGSGVGQPLVAATVEGESVLLLVDTGASETLLSRSLMRRLGASLAASEPGLDHVGTDVPTWTCVEALSLEVGGYRTRIPNVAVIDIPAELERFGVVGALCPQRLHPQATLRLDLFNAGMELLDGTGTGIVPDRECEDGLVAMTLPRVRVEGELSDLIVVEAAFDALPPTGIFFNTGARESEIANHDSIRLTTGAKRWVKGFGGTRARGRVVDTSLLIGNAIVPMRNVVARPQPHGFGGQLGMEILMRTCLEARAAADTLRWWVPPEWLPRTA